MMVRKCVAMNCFWKPTSPPIFHASSTRSASNRAASKRSFHKDFTAFEPYYNSVRTVCEPCTDNVTVLSSLCPSDRKAISSALRMGYNLENRGHRFNAKRIRGLNMRRVYICEHHCDFLRNNFMRIFGCLNPAHIPLREHERLFCNGELAQNIILESRLLKATMRDSITPGSFYCIQKWTSEMNSLFILLYRAKLSLTRAEKKAVLNIGFSDGYPLHFAQIPVSF